jgi:hypothetical protein
MGEMREALRAHHPMLRAVFFHYSKLFSLGEVHDARIASSAPPGRGGGALGGASAAETLSGRQLWRMLHNCGVLGKVVTVAHADRLAAVARRPQDDHFEVKATSHTWVGFPVYREAGLERRTRPRLTPAARVLMSSGGRGGR